VSDKLVARLTSDLTTRELCVGYLELEAEFEYRLTGIIIEGHGASLGSETHRFKY
jgi:hypothetical protein